MNSSIKRKAQNVFISRIKNYCLHYVISLFYHMSFYRGIIMSENTNFTKAELIDIIRLKNKEIEQLNEKCTDLENENQQYNTSNFYLEEENNSLYTRIEKLVKHNNTLEDQLYSIKFNIQKAIL